MNLRKRFTAKLTIVEEITEINKQVWDVIEMGEVGRTYEFPLQP